MLLCPPAPAELLQRKRRALADRKMPAFETAITALGNHYANAGQHREALAVYTEAAAVFAGQPTCRMQLGRAHRMAGEMYMLLEDFVAAGTHVEKFLRKRDIWASRSNVHQHVFGDLVIVITYSVLYNMLQALPSKRRTRSRSSVPTRPSADYTCCTASR